MSEMQLLLLDLKHLILRTWFVLTLGGKRNIGEKITQFFENRKNKSEAKKCQNINIKAKFGSPRLYIKPLLKP